MLLQTTTIRAEYESTTHSSFGATSVTYIRECASGAALGEHCRLRRLRRHLAQEPQQLDQPTPLEHVHACRYHRLLRRGHPTSSKTTAIASSDTLVRTSLERRPRGRCCCRCYQNNRSHASYQNRQQFDYSTQSSAASVGLWQCPWCAWPTRPQAAMAYTLSN